MIATASVDRIEALAWEQVARDLDEQGHAVVQGLIDPDECETLAALYPQDAPFRSRVIMARHGFGRGEYKYFNYPLPETIHTIRTRLYPFLAPIANHWNESMNKETRFPPSHAEFLDRCHAAGIIFHDAA